MGADRAWAMACERRWKLRGAGRSSGSGSAQADAEEGRKKSPAAQGSKPKKGSH